ncbi:C6 zinc finger domain-containing protein [Lindgomyces ingoldianus]|uniref:C6 zinc finger domain-containing protein n=1 Tax=Lindgomyces ingoldianus TaxID=673940 RepID=A0ACB6QWA4_9PLEO|nr:C6 zinc finger domain-containing protein [Lindgomyces ingoldianus]KAF2471146.1 C6 zinc finger domain-containing protein [Lindgomyces ingoldianus]
MEENRKRHCWECLRRCLVCDSTRPICKRCSTSGTVCPGYSDAKPARLRWLAPGRVKSRNRRLKETPSNKIENSHDEMTTRAMAELSRWTDDLVIPRFEINTETCDLVQAAEYCKDNTCIYQDLIPIHQLGPNPYIYPVSPAHFQSGATLPDHLRLVFVCMALSHRINRTRNDPQCKALAVTFYRYRGIVIRSLSEDINVEYKRTSDILLAGIISLLLADTQQGASPNWRCHLKGIERLITLRGGIRALAGSKHLESLLLCFVFVSVIGNTTSPASDLALTSSHLDELDFILEKYGGRIFTFHLCPPPLFAEIVKINHLRTLATKREPAGVGELSQEAYEILSRIHGFSPEPWADSKPSSKEDWMLIGNVYQAAVALYCISSLQSLSVLPLSHSLRSRCTTHSQSLYVLLNEALSSPKIKRFMLWPLVLLGVEAVNGGAAMRAFVEKQLPEISRHVGTYVPLMAKGVLERFWASGEMRWDACFDKPYALTTQIAIDISRILPL